MKKIYSLILVLFILNLFGQINNTEVVYKFILVNDSILASKSADFIKKQELAVSKIAHKIKPKLIFNDSVGIFFSEQILDEDNSSLNEMGRIFCNCEKPIFYNKKKDKIYYNFPEGIPVLDQDYTIYENLTKDWVLTKETKKINNYTCYKATTKFEVLAGSKPVVKNVVAWYCPELPYSYGPVGYGGLPGLIIELQENNNFYGIESLKINSNQKITPIKMYKLATVNEFFTLVNEGVPKHMKNK